MFKAQVYILSLADGSKMNAVFRDTPREDEHVFHGGKRYEVLQVQHWSGSTSSTVLVVREVT